MAIEKTINIKLDASEAISDLKKVRGEIDITYAELRKTTPIELDGTKAKNVLKNLDTDIKKSAKNTEQIGKNAEGSVGGFKQLKISTQAFGTALKATGIGIALGIFVKLQEALSQNQVIMDTFNVVTENISITFQKLINVLVKTTQQVLGFFNKVGKVIKTFVSQDLDGIKNGYEGLGNASDKLESKTKSLGRQMVELRNEVKLAEAEQRLLQLTYQKEAELQRQIRDDVSLTMQERITANEELGKILDKQFAEEQAIAQKKIDLAEMELSKNKDNIDLQVALINAKTEMADLDERITGQRSEQLINLTTLQREQADAIQAIQDKKDLEDEKAQAILDEQLAAEQKAADDLLALKEKEATALKVLANKKAADELKATEDKIAMNKAMEISGAQSILGALGQLAGEGTKLAKATAVSSILINTAQGVSAAIKAGAGLVFPANLGAIVTGVGAVLSGIASAKAILKKVPEGVDPPDTDTDIGSIDTPSLQEMNTGSLGGLIPNMNTIEPVSTAPIQAFVVENDISNAQALQEELEIQATL